MMTNILLIPNTDKKNSLCCANEIAAELVQLGITPLADKQYAGKISGCVFDTFDRLLERCDLLLPIGGDGTILRVMAHATQANKPILGINTGTVGFLTQLEPSELHALEKLKAGQYTIENRMMLEVKLGNEVRKNVLNDIVIQTKGGNLTSLVVERGDKTIAVQRANGLIFATPTGSTAYSLAAGGSIADPELEVIILTAICPHSAYNRSFILPAEGEYTIGTPDGEHLRLSFDGEDAGELYGDEKILVRNSKSQARFINIGLRDFYSSIYDKLNIRR